jgi:hypothetical protein
MEVQSSQLDDPAFDAFDDSLFASDITDGDSPCGQYLGDESSFI